jgi:hypothetical protein
MYKYRNTIVIFVLIVLLFVSYRIFSRKNDTNITANSGKFDVSPPKASMTLNKDFTFPIKDDKGNELTKFTYTIDTAELRDEIVVQGQKTTAVAGRTFLILTLKITNSFDKNININARDYIRLSVNGNDKELLAADIHNDPVSIQAISTKYSRLGFPINETDKKLKLSVGEIDGNKQNIDLNLSYK